MEGNPRVSTELLLRKRWSNGSMEIITSPERSPIWIEPKPKKKITTNRKAAVLYYLSRNGHLEHPHLIEVPLPTTSHGGGLLLRDVMNSLNMHRGKGMANMYSWSSKRSYKNGYVWHDVSEDDLIHSTNGHDYILKGTLLVQTSSPEYSRSHDETHSSTQTPPEPEAITSVEDSNSPAAVRRVRNQSWSSFDNPQEYAVHYKCESNRELAGKFAADAATQTTEDQERRRRSSVGQSVETIMISPPQLNNSSEDGGSSSDSVSALRGVGEMRDRTVVEERFPSGRMKASKVLMQLISCGTVSANDVVMSSKQKSDFDNVRKLS